MTRLLLLGKWLFIIPFAIDGILHFALPDFTATLVPRFFPFPLFWVYLVGVALLLFFVSAALGKRDQLAALLLAALLLVFVLTIHLPALGSNPLAAVNLVRDVMTMGAALIYAGTMAKDRTFAP